MKYCFIAFLLFISLSANAFKLPKLIPYRAADIWGYCDSTKRIIIAPQYLSAEPFYGNTAVVQGFLGYYLIDTLGNRTKPDESVLILEGEAHHGVRIFIDTSNQMQYGLVNERGEVVLAGQPLSLSWISNDYIVGITRHGLNSRGIFNWQGKLVTECGKNYFIYGWDGNADSSRFINEGRHRHFGVIDTSGRIVIPFRYDKVVTISCGRYLVTRKDSVFIFDLNGNVLQRSRCDSKNDGVFHYYCDVPDSVYENNCYGNENRLPYRKRFEKDGYCGEKDKDGKLVVPLRYAYILDYDQNGLALVIGYKEMPNGKKKKDYNLGYIDIYGTEYWQH